nr:MAG TPA: hypothetical protein [Caudoviricetes sp.]
MSQFWFISQLHISFFVYGVLGQVAENTPQSFVGNGNGLRFSCTRTVCT